MKTLKRLSVLIGIALIAVSCCDCPSGDPQNTITAAQAEEMRLLYKDNQHKFINMGIEQNYQNGEPDNLGALIEDIDDFQKYLISVKKEAKAQGKLNPAIKVSYGAKLDAEGVPRAIPYFVAINRTGDDLLDFEIIEYPGTFYDKLDPMGEEPEEDDGDGSGGDGNNDGNNSGGNKN